MPKILTTGIDSTPGQAFDVKPKKSKKRARYTTHSESVEGEEPSVPIAEQAGTTSTPVEDIPSIEDRLKEKTRKKQARIRSTIPVEGLVEVQEAPKKNKKRKLRVGENANQPEGEDTSIPESDRSPEEPPKKKHKNRTNFSDPRVDTTLNSQSRKGA